MLALSHRIFGLGGGALIAAAAMVGATPAAAQDGAAETQRAWHWLARESDEESQPYGPVAMFCVSPGENRVIIFESFAPETQVSVGILDDGELDVRSFRVGPVDAGVGQRYFSLTDADSGEAAGLVHMVAPGAYGHPDDIYQPTLTSVTIGDERTDCLFDPGMRFMAYTYDGVVAISEAEQGGLVLTRWRWWSDEPELRLTGGYWADSGRDGSAFVFPGRGALTFVSGGRSGADYPAVWTSNGEERTASDFLIGYFVADMRTAGDASDALSYALALHFERLDNCQHFAGEWSGNPARDAQVADGWRSNGCEDLTANQRFYLSAYRGDRRISAALRLFDLSDLFPGWPRR